jgi:hypothetical protein
MMDVTTLKRANELNEKIKVLQEVLNYFEWSEEDGGGSRNPGIIIEYDDEDGVRSREKIPIQLSNDVVTTLKSEVKKARDGFVVEFNNL